MNSFPRRKRPTKTPTPKRATQKKKTQVQRPNQPTYRIPRPRSCPRPRERFPRRRARGDFLVFLRLKKGGGGPQKNGLRGGGRGKWAAGSNKTEIRSGSRRPTYAASFTGAVKLIVTDSHRMGKINAAARRAGQNRGSDCGVSCLRLSRDFSQARYAVLLASGVAWAVELVAASWR